MEPLFYFLFEALAWIEESPVFSILSAAVVFYILERTLGKHRVGQVLRKGEKQLEDLYTGDPQLAEVQPSDIPDLDHGFYDRVQGEMEELGFRFAADIENVKLTAQMPNHRTFARLFLYPGGRVFGECVHLKTRGWGRVVQLLTFSKYRNIKTVGYVTVLGDGAVVSTAACTMPKVFSNPDDFFPLHMAEATPVPEVFRTHLDRVREIMTQRGVSGYLTVENLEDFRDCVAYLDKRSYEHRKKQGGYTSEEVANLAKISSSATQKRLAATVREMKKKEEHSAAHPVRDSKIPPPLPKRSERVSQTGV